MLSSALSKIPSSPLLSRCIMSASAASIRYYRTCIVGAGPTGTVAAALIDPVDTSTLPSALPKSSALSKLNVSVDIFEKSRGVGGRMSTTRASGAGGGAKGDLGAQYLTRIQHMKLQKSSVKDWFACLEKAGVLTPLIGTVVGMKERHKLLKHYVAKDGLSSVVKHFLAQSNAHLHTAKRVTGLELTTKTAANGADGPALWNVTFEGGAHALYDAVILTCPVPQILAMDGDVGAMLSGAGVEKELNAVKYSSRYSLVLYFAADDAPALAEMFPFVARFVDASESDAVRYIGFDTYKRTGSASSEPAVCIVVHSSVEFGATYVDTEPGLVEPILIENLKRLYPALPEIIESKCHRWRYSQVTHAYNGPEPYVAESMKEVAEPEPKGSGAVADAVAATSRVGAIMVMDNPPLILAGDAFTSSNFEGCIASGEKAAMLLRQSAGLQTPA